MNYLDLTLPTLAENLTLDEALLLQWEAERGEECLRVWEWPFLGVVLGAGCRLAEDLDEMACRQDGVEIARRSSGGGTVLLGPGCLCYSLILSYERDDALREIGSSYYYILGRVAAALQGLLPDVKPAGISDLTSHDLKLSGNAQQRKSLALLHHGTLLYDFDLTRVSRYLKQPLRQPDYRAGRPHVDFLMNLPTSAKDLKERLRLQWEAGSVASSWPEVEVRRLTEEKYLRPEWLRRRET